MLWPEKGSFVLMALKIKNIKLLFMSLPVFILFYGCGKEPVTEVHPGMIGTWYIDCHSSLSVSRLMIGENGKAEFVEGYTSMSDGRTYSGKARVKDGVLYVGLKELAIDMLPYSAPDSTKEICKDADYLDVQMKLNGSTYLKHDGL